MTPCHVEFRTREPPSTSPKEETLKGDEVSISGGSLIVDGDDQHLVYPKSLNQHIRDNTGEDR